MTRRTLVSILALLVGLSALVATAQQRPAPSEPTAGSSPGIRAAGPEPSPTPMMQSIRAVFAAEKDEVAALEIRLEAATSEEEIIGLIREIERVRMDAEIGVLTIQADCARHEGRIEQAQQIEAAIKKMQAGPPRAAGQPTIDRIQPPTSR